MHQFSSLISPPSQLFMRNVNKMSLHTESQIRLKTEDHRLTVDSAFIYYANEEMFGFLQFAESIMVFHFVSTNKTKIRLISKWFGFGFGLRQWNRILAFCWCRKWLLWNHIFGMKCFSNVLRDFFMGQRPYFRSF